MTHQDTVQGTFDSPEGASHDGTLAEHSDSGGCVLGPLEPGQRWSANRKRKVVLRLLRGESMAALSRELGVEIYRLEQWKQRALAGMDASLRARSTTPERIELDAAHKRLGELMMDNELLLERCKRSAISPLPLRRSGK